MEIKPIAHIESDFKEKFGIPRQSGRVNSLKARVVFEEEFSDPMAFRGIEEYSYLWILFDFSLAHGDGTFHPTVRPPRLGGNKRVGVFATRSPNRPNNIGLSSVQLVGVEKDEKNHMVLIVAGADLLDGTPIYDIKPYVPYADCHMDAKAGFPELYKDYSLNVIFPEELISLVKEEKREALLGCLKDDPRPSYIKDPERIYGMRFDCYEIKFKVEEDTLTVVEVLKD